MAQLAVFIAGVLLIAESQASDVAEADPSAVQGFLTQYMQASMQHSPTAFKGDQFASSSHTFAKQNKDYMIIDDKPVFHPEPRKDGCISMSQKMLWYFSCT